MQKDVIKKTQQRSWNKQAGSFLLPETLQINFDQEAELQNVKKWKNVLWERERTKVYQVFFSPFVDFPETKSPHFLLHPRFLSWNWTTNPRQDIKHLLWNTRAQLARHGSTYIYKVKSQTGVALISEQLTQTTCFTGIRPSGGFRPVVGKRGVRRPPLPNHCDNTGDAQASSPDSDLG